LGTNPGINFIHISLTELDFKLNKQFKLPKDGIPVDLGLKVKHSFSRDKKSLTTILSVVLFSKIKNSPFKMKVSVEGVFVGDDSNELKMFSKVHAPAHLFPFIRETIGNTTMKANIPPLLLPPFNLSAILTEQKSSKKT
jgi:preprotein translocase subunit SecB